MSEPHFKRKDGYGWNDALYKKLLSSLKSYKINTLEQLSKMSLEDAKVITLEVYTKNGNRKNYYENLYFFVQSNSDAIFNDMQSLHMNESVRAPELKNWLDYQNELIEAIKSCTNQLTISQCINNESFSYLSSTDKKNIYHKLYGCEEKIDVLKMKKLNNALNSKWKELVYNLKSANNCSVFSNSGEASDQISQREDEAVMHCAITKDLCDATQAFAIADDIATSLVIDIYYLGKKTRKINQNIIREFEDDEDFVSQVQNAIQNFKLPIATIIVNLLDIIKAKFKDLTITESLLKRQLKSYLQLIEPNSALSIRPCNRFSKNVNQGVTIVAKRLILKNTILHQLNGMTVRLTENELNYLIKNKLDFSLMISGASNSTKIWLGPGSYVNHECQPNTKLYQRKANGSLCLQALQNILEGEEISWNYGRDYFAPGECECATCKITPEICKPTKVVVERLSDLSVVNNTFSSNSSVSPDISVLNFSENTINEILGLN